MKRLEAIWVNGIATCVVVVVVLFLNIVVVFYHLWHNLCAHLSSIFCFHYVRIIVSRLMFYLPLQFQKIVSKLK